MFTVSHFKCVLLILALKLIEQIINSKRFNYTCAFLHLEMTIGHPVYNYNTKSLFKFRNFINEL